MAFIWIVTAILFMFFDVWYFVQCAAIIALCAIRRKLYTYDILDEATYPGICLTTDLDVFLHMNNARYLRECDFGRYLLWCQNGVWDTVFKMNGGISLGGSTIRYRKSIQLFDRYTVKSRVLCWDEKAFYVEQRFVRTEDNFVMAILLAKQNITKISPADAVKAIKGRQVESPPFPEEVKTWINYNQISSENLKKKI